VELYCTGDIPPQVTFMAYVAYVDSGGLKLLVSFGLSYVKLVPELYLYILLSLDVASRKWSILPQHGKVPSSRKGASFAYYQNSVYMSGGETAEDDAELHRYDLSSYTWSVVSVAGTKPAPRASANMFMQYPYLYLLNGWNLKTGGYFTDYFSIDISQPQPHWRQLEVQGLGGSFIPLAAVGVLAEGAYYISGGILDSGVTNQMMVLKFDGTGSFEASLVNKSFEFPEPRMHAPVIYNAGKLYMFGGVTTDGQ
jgi:hypothetical protein